MVKVLDEPKSWKKELKKIHSQMCHVPVKRIKSNLERGGVWKPEMEDILTDIEKKCKVNDCRSRAGGQRGRRPVVSFPRALRVGQSVAMDLKIRHGKKPILYMVDQFSRFTLGVVIKNKELTTVSEAVIINWIGAGYPRIKNIHTDNGGDSCGDVSNKLASIIGATRTTTAGRTPYQNGMCEKIHQILDHMMERVMEEDPSIPEKVALSWAVNAHNNMNMESGYTPRFLMFGEAQDLPGIWTAGPAGLGEMDLPAQVAHHLHAREIARKVQVQADTCIRLKRALRANIRPTGDKKEVGTWVYMKRMEDRQWKGPGQVWAQLGTNIMIKQGSTIWHARHEDCIRVREEDEQELEREAEMMNQGNAKQNEEEPLLRKDEAAPPETTERDPISEQEQDDGVELQEENGNIELQVLTRRRSKRNSPSGAGNDNIDETGSIEQEIGNAETNPEDETSPAEDSLPTPEDITSQSEGNEEEEEEANAETNDQEEDDGETNYEEETSPAEESQSTVEENSSDQSAETETSHGTPPGGQAATNRMRPTVQLGDPSYLPGLDGGKEVPSPEVREEVKSRHSGSKKSGGGNSNNLRMKKARDLGLRSGMIVKIAVEDGSVLEGTVLKRTTKKSGKYPNNYDVKNNASSEVIKDVNFDLVDWHVEDEEDITVENICQVTEEEVHGIFATMIEKERHGEEGVIEAKKKELESIKSYGTYEEVWSSEVPVGDRDKVITTTRNVVEKDDHRIKARVCVRGFQEKTSHRRDSPTASKISQRLFSSKAVEKGWKVYSLDVSAAFLQGDFIDRTVYVIPPKEFVSTRPKRQEPILWKLVRPLYGLTDASRKWYCRMDKELTKLGCLRSKYDHAV